MSENQTVNTDRYYGPNKVMTVQVLNELKTPLGSEMVRLTYENGRGAYVAKNIFELLVKDEATDATSFMELRKELIANELINVLTEYGLTHLESAMCMQHLMNKLDNAYDRVAHEKVSTGGGAWFPGADWRHFTTLLDLHEVIPPSQEDESTEEQEKENPTE